LDQIAFWHAVAAEEGLTWVGVTETEAVVRGPRSAFTLTPATIAEEEWEQMRDVLLGRRPLVVLTYLTRIVGYYSNERNWNPSKLVEQRDRRRGNYVVTGRMPPVPIPQLVQEALAKTGAEMACELQSARSSAPKS